MHEKNTKPTGESHGNMAQEVEAGIRGARGRRKTKDEARGDSSA